MADYSDIISQYGGTPASDYSDIISQFGGVPEKKAASPVFEKPFFGVAPKTSDEAISNILDIGALMAGGAGLAARQYAKPVMEGRPLAPLAPIAEAAKGAVTLPILAGQAAFGDENAMRLTGEYGGRLLSLPANVMANYGEAYGSPEAAFRTAALQPGRFATDIMGVPSLAAGGVRTAGRALGAGADAVSAVGRFVAPVVRPAFRSEEAAVESVINRLAQPREFAEAIQQTPVSVPGAPAATATQRAVAANVMEPSIASMEAGLMNVDQPYGREIFAREQTRAAAIRDQIARIDTDIARRAEAMTPSEAAEKRTIRDELNRQLAAETKKAEATARGVISALPETSQFEVGKTIQERSAILESEAKQERIKPLFRRAEKLAGDESNIDTATLRRRVANIFEDRLSEYVPLSETARRVAGLPDNINLKTLDDIRKAVGRDIARAKTSAAQGVAVQLPDLSGVYDAVYKTLERSNVDPTAKSLYRKAISQFKQEIVPRFETGIAADIGAQRKNVPRLAYEQTVPKFLESEQNATQFATTFRNDPVATKKAKEGLLEMARRAADPEFTGLVNADALNTFIESHKRRMGLSGIDQTKFLTQVRDAAANAKLGMDQIAARAERMGSVTVDDLIEKALSNPMDMDFLYRSLKTEGRSALGKEVANRIASKIEAKAPEDALKLLGKKPINMVLGKERVAELRDTASIQRDLIALEKRAPEALDPTPAKLDAAYSREDLLNFQTLADEISRLERVESIGGVPRATSPTRLATEMGAEVGITPEAIPSFISPVITTAKSAFKMLRGRADRRVTLQLVNLLYRDPDRLGQLILDALDRKAAPAPTPAPVSPMRRARQITGAVNVLTQSQNQNAMAR